MSAPSAGSAFERLKIMGRQVIAYSSTILIAALLLTGGCNREDLGPCEASVAPECDITDPACVAAHSDHVVCIRGIEASVPSLELVSPATAQSQLYGAPRPVTVNDRCLETLGLESFETQRSEPEVPGAIYSLTDRKVLVVDPDDSRAILRMIALAHVDEGVDFIDFVGDAETTDAQIARSLFATSTSTRLLVLAERRSPLRHEHSRRP